MAVHSSHLALTHAYGHEVVRRKRYREALIETSIVVNAALAAHTLQREVRSWHSADVRAVYGVFLLDTHEVWTPPLDGVAHPGLSAPPADLTAFHRFGDALVRSDRIAKMLEAV